ncbi:hypothetical protein ACJX0J_019995, partial [Zea mays]
ISTSTFAVVFGSVFDIDGDEGGCFGPLPVAEQHDCDLNLRHIGIRRRKNVMETLG